MVKGQRLDYCSCGQVIHPYKDVWFIVKMIIMSLTLPIQNSNKHKNLLHFITAQKLVTG